MQESTRNENKENLENSQFSILNSQLGLQNKPQSKPLNLLGLAKKAGLLAIGSEDVKSAIRAGKAKLIIYTTDISEGSVKRVLSTIEDSEIISTEAPFEKFEFGRVAGRGSPGIIAFLDLGLAAEFMKRLSELDKTRYGEIARTLETRAKAFRANNQSAKRRTKI